MTAHEVTPAHVPPYPGAGLPAAEVARILHRLDPAALQEAGAAHTALGRELDTMAAQLTQESRTLAQHWSGTAARRALAQFQRLHTQTATLAAQAGRTGAVLTWLGTQVVPAFRGPAGAGQAQQYLTGLSTALVRANGALPPEIGGPGTAHLAAAATGPRGSAPAHAAPAAPAPSPSPATGAPAPAPLISRPTIRPTRAKQLTDTRSVAQDSGLSGGALPLPPATATDLASPAPLTAATPVPASHPTAGALPLAGGVARQPDHERHRDSWAPEDRNPWRLPDTCVPPLIEGT